MPLEEAWLRHVQQARWFAGKGLEVRSVAIEPLGFHTPAGALPAVRSELARFSHPDRTDDYHLLVGYLAPGTAGPAGFVGRTTLPGLGPVEVVDATASPLARTAFLTAVGWADGDPVPRLFAGEQSNSTLIAGQTMVKVIRRVEAGRNPDAEALDALTATGVTPRLRGVLSDSGYDLAIASERILDAADGWAFACRACADAVPIDAELVALGAALRTVHQRLASAFGLSVRTGDEIRQTMLERLDTARAAVVELRPYAAGLADRYAVLAGRELPVQRVHADFHLGQALLAPDGWKLIDFEGEPGRPLAERRLPHPEERDLAGLLRSLDYARSAHRHPDRQQARSWCRRGREAFLDGYGKAGVDLDVLRAYETDRAVYEVTYEVRNRPDWAAIPLAAVQDGISRSAVTAAAQQEESDDV
ncbi:MAG: phosphotransferase [Propionicimonas sp.]|nr:phosphotransferase [Propionicimonas sp.]